MKIKLNQLRNLSLAFTGLALLLPALASAHVIVTPNQAGIGSELVFNISSPNEQKTPIIKLTVAMPKSVSTVVPTEKDGWTTSTTASGSGTSAATSSITWSGGQIPVGQREDFSFSAQVPGSSSTLDWKAYQTYADGTVVHWDQTPNGKSDDATGNAGPYSTTKVINDLAVAPATTTKSSSSTLPLLVGFAALIVSVFTLLRSSKKD